jgi:hypothetical protein
VDCRRLIGSDRSDRWNNLSPRSSLDQMDFYRESAEIHNGHGDGDMQPNPWIRTWPKSWYNIERQKRNREMYEVDEFDLSSYVIVRRPMTF